jgi:ferredoxin
MKVWIDSDLCSGGGGCSEIAPDIFVLLDNGTSAVKQNGVVPRDVYGQIEWAQIPDDRIDAARHAAEQCPGEIIQIDTNNDDDTAQVVGVGERSFVVREHRREMPEYRHSREFTEEEGAFLDEEYATKPREDWMERRTKFETAYSERIRALPPEPDVDIDRAVWALEVTEDDYANAKTAAAAGQGWPIGDGFATAVRQLWRHDQARFTLTISHTKALRELPGPYEGIDDAYDDNLRVLAKTANKLGLDITITLTTPNGPETTTTTIRIPADT